MWASSLFDIDHVIADKIDSLLSHIDSDAVVFDAFNKEQLCGFVWSYPYERVEETVLHIAYIAILPKYRGYSISTCLIKEVERCAKEKDINTLEVIVSDNNKPAHAIYKKAHFVADRIIMVKEVAE